MIYNCKFCDFSAFSEKVLTMHMGEKHIPIKKPVPAPTPAPKIEKATPVVDKTKGKTNDRPQAYTYILPLKNKNIVVDLVNGKKHNW